MKSSTRIRLKKSLRVLALCDAIESTTLNQNVQQELQTEDWKTEGHILEALRELGCVADLQPIFDDTDLIRQKVEEFNPDVIFNQADQFKNNRGFDQNIAAFLELQELPFTGCGSNGLMLCKNKSISKKILSYHNIRVPDFMVVRRGRKPALRRRLSYPILVKPLKEEASFGISQASLVENDTQFEERVVWVHGKFDQDVIAEEYIAGRELYVSVFGNHRLKVFPIREMVFREVPAGEPTIATFKVKWDKQYRERWGIDTQFAETLNPKLTRKIEQVCKKIYHLLAIDGYARLDLRLTPDNQLVFIEANPNPMLARDEDFAKSAQRAGWEYPDLIARIIQLGFNTVRE